MKWAVAQGYGQDNPAAEAITAALPKRSKRVRHMPALPHGEVAGAPAGPRLPDVGGDQADLRVPGVDGDPFR